MATAFFPLETALPSRPSIRVLVADPNQTRRDRIERAIAGIPAFLVVPHAGSGEACRWIIENECPELVISSSFFASTASSALPFPLYILVGSTSMPAESVVCSIAAPVQEAELTAALEMALPRILTIKAGELSALIRQYVLHGGASFAPAGRLSVEQDGATIEIDPGEVRWIKAAGNYVELHTRNGMYVVREPMRRVAARLKAAGFVRIHRGTIVNIDAVRSRIMDNGVPTSLVTDDGAQLQIGPNFRAQIPEDIPVSPHATIS